MITKLHIHGILEVEGSEQFVREVYNDYKNNATLTKSPTLHTANLSNNVGANISHLQNNNSKQENKADNKKSKKTAIHSYKLVDAITKHPNIQSIKTFYEQFESLSNPECVTVFMYCLKKTLQVENVTADHIFTCYRLTNARVPKNLLQAIRDAKSKKFWVDHDNWEDLKINYMGEQAVEQDFARKKAA